MARSDPEVEAVLASAGLQELAPLFAAEDIDASLLWSLKDADLRDIGLTLGQRRRLLQQIEGRQGAPALIQSPADLRRLTVLFSDLVGYTALAASMDPDELRPILADYHQTARKVAADHGGYVASLQGDGVVILFGFPATRGADAERAVEAAHALTAALRQMRHRAPGGRAISLSLRVGLASGQAIVSFPEGTASTEPQMVGPVLNRAARLQAIAAPGTVATDEPTQKLAARAFPFARLPDADLKGFDRKVPVFHALEPTGDWSPRDPSLPDPPPAVQSAHVAQARQLAQALDHARAGARMAVLMTGDAGIGKSTLLNQLSADAARSGVAVLRLSYRALCSHLPLWPVADLIRSRLAALGANTPDSRLAGLGRLLAPAPAPQVQAVARLVGLSPADGPATTPPQEDRRLLLDALAGFLAGNGDGPQLVAIEDVHWADATTQEVLALAQGRAGPCGSLFVATSRNPQDPLWRDLPHRLHLPLPPLERTLALQVLSSHLPGHTLPEEVTNDILARSGGNPLMLESLARAARNWQDAARGPGFEAPASIYEGISARLDLLRTGRGVAAALSVLDDATDLAVLAEVTGADPAGLAAPVAELVAAGLIDLAGPDANPALRFRHALYREICYERLVKSDRQRLHLAALKALSSRLDDRAPGTAGLLSWHAFEGGDHDRAAPLCLRAGEEAMQRSALIEAGHFLNRASEALDHAPPSRTVQELWLRLLVARASVCRATQGIASQEVGLLGRQTLDLARSLGNSHAEMVALGGLYSHALVRADYGAAKGWAESLAQTAAASQDRTFAMIGNRGRGVVALHTGALATGAALLQAALDGYDEARDLPLAHAHGYDHAEICAVFLSFALWLLGDPVRAAQVGDFAISHSRRIGHIHSLAQALAFRAMLAALARDWATASACAQEAAEVSGRHGLPVMRGVGAFFARVAHLMAQPAPPSADDLSSLRQSLQDFAAVNPWNYHVLAGTLVAELHLQGKEVDRAKAFLAQAEDIQTRTGEVFAAPELDRIKALLLGHAGDADLAHAALLAAHDAARAGGQAMLALRIACDIAMAQKTPAATGILRAARAGLVSADAGWDLSRCQALLERAQTA